MAFLSSTDYDVFIKADILNDVLQEVSITLGTAETLAQAQMESYLSARYDTVNIFNKTGSERNLDIVEKMIHLVLYKVHKPLAPQQVPKHIMDDYADTIHWLEKVCKLEINPDLPVLDTGEKNYIQYGSNPKRNPYY